MSNERDLWLFLLWDINIVVFKNNYSFLGLLGKVSETIGEYLQVAIDTYNLLNTAFPEG